MAACGGAAVQAVVGSVSVGEVVLSSHRDKSNGLLESGQDSFIWFEFQRTDCAFRGG